jgi:glycosyltransferase involved in cell wall biosynthesis
MRHAGGPLVLTSSLDGVLAAPDPAREPRIDYLEIARAMSGELLHPSVARGPWGRLEERTRRFGDWRQARRARATDARAFLSLTERAAMALTVLDHRRPHVVVGHHLTSPRRRALQRRTGWLRRLDRVVVFSRRQYAYLVEEAGVAVDRVRYVRHPVDERFFAPQGAAAEELVVSAGQHRRDYRTLVEAARRLGVPTEIAASSPWMADAAPLGVALPGNVTLRRRLDRLSLRALYDRASVVVVPLEAGLELPAGVNAVLEAMAMRKPLVVSATPGIADYVDDGENALVVPAGDSEALAAAIERLLRDRDRADRLAAAGRDLVEAGRNLDAYVNGLAAVVGELVPLERAPALTSGALFDRLR